MMPWPQWSINANHLLVLGLVVLILGGSSTSASGYVTMAAGAIVVSLGAYMKGVNRIRELADKPNMSDFHNLQNSLKTLRYIPYIILMFNVYTVVGILSLKYHGSEELAELTYLSIIGPWSFLCAFPALVFIVTNAMFYKTIDVKEKANA